MTTDSVERVRDGWRAIEAGRWQAEREAFKQALVIPDLPFAFLLSPPAGSRDFPVECEHDPRGGAVLWLILYILTIYGANWAISTFGVVPVGFGLAAPAGVYFAGLAFTLRDLVQERLGRTWAIRAIVAGAALSLLMPAVSPQIAVASGAAFLLSETADFLVYTPLRKRNWLGAVFASNIVGLVVDSALFLMLAFGSLDFLAGQIVGKVWMTLLAVAFLALVRRWLFVKATPAPSISE